MELNAHFDYSGQMSARTLNLSPELLTGGQERTNSCCADQSTQHKPGVFIKTNGCQMNEYDSKKLLKILEPSYREVESPLDAQLVIVNTCSVRDKPEQKLYSVLGELKELKDLNPDLLIGVGGCVAQQQGKEIVRRSGAVDFVFGTHNLSLVPTLIDARQNGESPQVAVDYRDEWEELPLGLGGETKASTFISISRGCNKNCTYCIVPITRGKEVSRPLDELLREVRIQAHRGAREIVLLGQTVNSYGRDFSPRMSFVDLLERVAEIPGVERIRFTSPHPQEIRQDFIDFLVSCPKVCRHVHMPLQSGSNRILQLMNRNYRREKYLRIVESLRSRAPDVALTTDVIVGFPGETEQDFLETLEMLEMVQFDSSYSFIFSARPGTVAEHLPGASRNESEDKAVLDRLYRFQERQNQITTQRLQSWQGKTVEILIDGPSSRDSSLMKGRTSQNFVVNLQTPVPHLKPGMFATVKIIDVSRYTLKGNALAISQAPIADRSAPKFSFATETLVTEVNAA